jgi:hypothetical protein
MKEFVRLIRAAHAEPEQVKDVLFAALHDSGLQVLLRQPGELLDLPAARSPCR